MTYRHGNECTSGKSDGLLVENKSVKIECFSPPMNANQHEFDQCSDNAEAVSENTGRCGQCDCRFYWTRPNAVHPSGRR